MLTLSSSRRPCGSGFRLDEGNQAGNSVTTLKQVGDLFNLTVGASQIENGGQEMKSLAAEEVHGPDGFEKHSRRSSHPSFHDCIGDSIQESEIIKRRSFSVWRKRKCMLQAGFEPADHLRQIVLRKRCHRQWRRVMEP